MDKTRTMEKAMSYSGLIAGPRNTTISSGFYSLIRAIRRSNSKGEEERIVLKELELMRQNLSQPDISMKKMKEFMVRLIYCEMLGQSANFAYIHAIKMAQQGMLFNKRVGYLGVSLFLHSQHELILLLINTIQRDLNSTNVLDICGGLTACSNLIGPEMVPVVLPLVEQNLQHPQENVRRKAVLVLDSFLMKCPQLVNHMTEHFQQALCDRSPGVMTAALHIYHTLIKENSEHHKSLVRPLTSILKQVVQRKLSVEYEFRGIPAPWLQIQILRMLARLGVDPKTSQLMYDVLEEVLESSNNLSLISCGVQYECIMTIAKIHPNPSLLKKASICITRFLRSQSNNLKYLGMKALSVIHKVHPESCREHQMTVVECLEDDDPTIKRATMNLLYEMCTADNISVILDRMLDHLKSSSMEERDQNEHIHKMVSLAHQFHSSVRWYVSIIVKILSICCTRIPPNTIDDLIISIRKHEHEEAGLVSSLVEQMLTVAKQSHITDDLLKLITWVLGEFCHSEKSTIPVSEAQAVLCTLLSKAMSSTARCYVIAAIMKTVTKSGIVSQDGSEYLHECKNVQVKQISSELEMVCSDQDLISALPSKNVSQFDWTLSFLDEYVSDALGRGAAPYKPKQQRSAEKHNSPEVMRPFLSGLSFRPYTSHSPSMMTSTESSSSVTINNQEATSWSPTQSLNSDATGNSTDLELATRATSLRTEGIQKVWSQAGYSKEVNKKKISSKMSTMTQAKEDDSWKANQQPSVHIMPVTAVDMSTSLPVESAEERRKQELAKALFGGGRKQREENEIPQSHIKSSSDREGHTSSEAFADYCTEEGLIIQGETGQDVLVDFGIQSADDDRISSENRLISLDCTNKQDSDALQRNQKGIASKSNLGSSLLDEDEALPALPVDLEISPSSQVAEELVFDTNVRLMMRRVWQSDALILVFYMTGLVMIEGARIILDVPSNMKCHIGEQETNIIEMTPSGIVQAKLTCHVPATHMSLGGELTFKDATKTLKRLFFQATIHIRDLLRAKEITTEEFGKQWPELSLDQRLVQEVKGFTISGIMDMMTSIHLFPVEIIGEEGILAASFLQSSTCLIHIKLSNHKLDIWVKSRSKLLSQILANKCASLIANDVKK